jgi:acyl CoA:acetate/3-ketoacid CoA transferase
MNGDRCGYEKRLSIERRVQGKEALLMPLAIMAPPTMIHTMVNQLQNERKKSHPQKLQLAFELSITAPGRAGVNSMIQPEFSKEIILVKPIGRASSRHASPVTTIGLLI